MPQYPDLDEVIRASIEHALMNLNTSQPAVVQRYYDDGGPVADVIPLVKRQYPRSEEDRTGTAGERDWVAEARAPVMHCRVLFPRCGGFSMTLPVSKGDVVLLVHTQQDIGRWASTGHTGAAEPDMPTLHPGSNGVCIVGLFPNTKKLPTRLVGTDAIVFGHESGSGEIKFKSDSAEFFGTKEVALAERVKALEADFRGHLHPAGSPNTGAPIVPAGGQPPQRDYGTPHLKAGD